VKSAFEITASEPAMFHASPSAPRIPVSSAIQELIIIAAAVMTTPYDKIVRSMTTVPPVTIRE
jgi:hypothetical protein